MIDAVARAGSVRKASEEVNITASALIRRIQGFEDEFGSEIFERLPSGMRLNPAGELLMHHIREQINDLARVQSQVADLSGLRRGHVSIACSQALLPYFLPQQISQYRQKHPQVTFSVDVRDRDQAEEDLSNFSSDLALVFEPLHRVEFEVIQSIEQPVNVLYNAGHPLGQLDAIRLRDCLEYPCVMPSARYGVRSLLDTGAKHIGRPLAPVLETESFELIRHYVAHENAVGFQIPIGLDERSQNSLRYRPLPARDVPVGRLYLGQMKGRRLPVASSRFIDQVVLAMEKLTIPPP